MVTVNQPLDQRIKAFKQSSAFSSGDNLSFSIKFTDELGLPGKYNPEAYMTTSNISVAGRVAVICPGNGGICVELLHRGAAVVEAFEPRSVYHKALPMVSGFCNAAIGKSFSYSIDKSLPQAGLYDLVVWTEGLDEIRDPAIHLVSALRSLRSGGELLIEVAHGTHGLLPNQTNSWKPTIDSFESSIKKLGDYEIASSRPGRNQLRIIYKIKSKVPTPVAPPPAPKPVEASAIPQLSEEEMKMYDRPVDPPQPPKRRPRKAKQAPPEMPPETPLAN